MFLLTNMPYLIYALITQCLFVFLFETGVWFMHCHFERHTTWGMSSVVIVKNGDTNETSMRPPPSYMPPCS